MSITFKLLGNPGKDNALTVRINSGTKLYRLLFDCGENLLNELKYSEITSIDYLFFSHFHLDHAAGFDYFLRRNYDRQDKPVNIFGPTDTVKVIRHRLSGYTWNLVDKVPGRWIVNEFDDDNIKTYSFKAAESFSRKHYRGKRKFEGNLIDNDNFRVDAVLLNHIIPSAGYRITEKDAYNIDKERLRDSEFIPGPWLEKVKDASLKGGLRLELNNKKYSLNSLREILLKINKGESIAYLTDFVFDKQSVTGAVKLIKGCDTVFCESQYSAGDIELAKRNFHLTSKQAAWLARKANIKRLILFHISDRYDIKKDYNSILKEARQIFPATYFPEKWMVR